MQLRQRRRRYSCQSSLLQALATRAAAPRAGCRARRGRLRRWTARGVACVARSVPLRTVAERAVAIPGVVRRVTHVTRSVNPPPPIVPLYSSDYIRRERLPTADQAPDGSLASTVRQIYTDTIGVTSPVSHLSIQTSPHSH